MGLDAVTIGMQEIKETDIGEPEAATSAGHRIGACSFLHVLPGLGLRLETDGPRGLDKLGRVPGLRGDAGAMGVAAFDAAVEEPPWPNAAHAWGVLHLYAREPVRLRTPIAFC